MIIHLPKMYNFYPQYKYMNFIYSLHTVDLSYREFQKIEGFEKSRFSFTVLYLYAFIIQLKAKILIKENLLIPQFCRLNEGFTVFLERKILGRRKGAQMVDFAYIGKSQ